jgi:hypothetical protein
LGIADSQGFSQVIAVEAVCADRQPDNIASNINIVNVQI